MVDHSATIRDYMPADFATAHAMKKPSAPQWAEGFVRYATLADISGRSIFYHIVFRVQLFDIGKKRLDGHLLHGGFVFIVAVSLKEDSDAAPLPFRIFTEIILINPESVFTGLHGGSGDQHDPRPDACMDACGRHTVFLE